MGAGAGFSFIRWFVSHSLSKMLPAVSVPYSDGKGESSANYSHQVEPRRQATNLGPAERDSVLFSRMGSVAREACMAARSDVIMGRGWMRQVSNLFRVYFAPGAAGSVSHAERATQTMDEYLARFESSPRKAGAEMQSDWAFPEVPAPALCMQNAPLPLSRKSLVLAAVRGRLGISEVA